jgi:hypothetical protein
MTEQDTNRTSSFFLVIIKPPSEAQNRRTRSFENIGGKGGFEAILQGYC